MATNRLNAKKEKIITALYALYTMTDDPRLHAMANRLRHLLDDYTFEVEQVLGEYATDEFVQLTEEDALDMFERYLEEMESDNEL